MFFPSPQSGGFNPCPLLARCASQSPHRRWSQDFRVTLHYGLLHSYQSCSFCLSSRRIFKTMEISAVDVYFGCKWSWPPFEAFWSVDVLWRQYGTQLWPLITLHNASSSSGSSSKKKCIAGACEPTETYLLYVHTGPSLADAGPPSHFIQGWWVFVPRSIRDCIPGGLKARARIDHTSCNKDQLSIVKRVAKYKAQLT